MTKFTSKYRQKHFCVCATIDSSVETGNVCSTWCPRQISPWRQQVVLYRKHKNKILQLVYSFFIPK